MKIAIAGYGVEGKSSYGYFAARGHDVTIVDERPEIADLPADAARIVGANAFENLDQFDLVVRTPSLPPQKLTLARAVWSATNEFFAHCPAPIIGVTGTKGKGTTCSLAASTLRAAGKTVHLVGNIGTPALDVLASVMADDVVVYELSSFQLWDLEKSPHVAVVLMIEPDHLNVHADFEEYVASKSNIVRHQHEDDYVISHATNTFSRLIADMSRGQKVPFPADIAAHVTDGFFWYGEQKICSVDALQLPGAHNQDNACAAIDAVWLFTQNTQAIEQGLASFEGLPHRLKLVRTVDDVRYYDDSIATTPGSAIAAIQAFDAPKITILGGSGKGEADFTELAKAAASGNVKMALLIGDQAAAIEKSLRQYGVACDNLDGAVTLAQVVARAQKIAEPGDVVILSPACASFGMFKNYADRGDQFVAAVNGL